MAMVMGGVGGKGVGHSGAGGRVSATRNCRSRRVGRAPTGKKGRRMAPPALDAGSATRMPGPAPGPPWTGFRSSRDRHRRRGSAWPPGPALKLQRTDRGLLADAGLAPVAHAAWEHRLQACELRRVELAAVVGRVERLQLALQDVLRAAARRPPGAATTMASGTDRHRRPPGRSPWSTAPRRSTAGRSRRRRPGARAHLLLDRRAAGCRP